MQENINNVQSDRVRTRLFSCLSLLSAASWIRLPYCLCPAKPFGAPKCHKWPRSVAGEKVWAGCGLLAMHSPSDSYEPFSSILPFCLAFLSFRFALLRTRLRHWGQPSLLFAVCAISVGCHGQPILEGVRIQKESKAHRRIVIPSDTNAKTTKE